MFSLSLRFALSLPTTVSVSLCLWQDEQLLEKKNGEEPGFCQLIANWGKVASEQLKPIITGELMKTVRYQYRLTLTVACCVIDIVVSVRLCAAQMKADRKKAGEKSIQKVKEEGKKSSKKKNKAPEAADEAEEPPAQRLRRTGTVRY